jgi:hypothetical protein
MSGTGNRGDLDPLLEESVAVARRFLENRGEFFPFGMVLADKGEVAYVDGWTGDEQPQSKEVIDLLVSGFRRGAGQGKYLATALTADVRLSGRDGDAIRVTLEHRDGTAIHCFLPYRKSANGWEYGEVFATAAEPSVFGSDGS